MNHADVTTVSHEVPCLSLDTGRVDCDPLHVILGQLGVGLGLCLLADGLDGRRSVDGLLSAGDIGQPEIQSVAGMRSLFRHSLLLFRPVHHLGGGSTKTVAIDREAVCMRIVLMLCDSNAGRKGLGC